MFPVCVLFPKLVYDFSFFLVKPFCKPDQTKVYGVAKREKIHVSCEVVANPSDNLYFNWVFNSSSERLDLQENLISNQGSKSVAEHTPQVRILNIRLTHIVHHNQKYFSMWIMSSKILDQNRLGALKKPTTHFPIPKPPCSESKEMSTEKDIVKVYLSF